MLVLAEVLIIRKEIEKLQMFSSDYDGCESDSSSSSDSCYDNRSVNAVEISKAKAMEFDELMNKELDLLIRSVHQKATDSKTERKQNENLRVRFKKDHDDDVDFPVYKDPLCDYEEDEANAKWVQENLPGGKSKKSDAILNCPGCMSVLSLVSHSSDNTACFVITLNNQWENINPLCVFERLFSEHNH
ncbi:hypothetical protein Smp_004260 [Schistosoma mansoni]|uniref:hypothetical protein n=1 Tax=Schistosoma mansoni TaxID=6183 RepID=UPI0001A6441F|nr:hypothetical protein Smp_004260 [Schistosoma mansoni]|eukprot:XP_018650242.1 hypothetical protein Smp_004260 [Schistosoma mansoni]